MDMQLTGPYIGVVVANADPAKLGRIKASVPHVFGVADSSVSPVGISDLPWAIPAGLPAGGSQSSGGIDWLPEPGDQVLVFFLDGEPEKPVWMWMMQTLDQANATTGFPLHHYSNPTAKGRPDRAGLTRYGHTIEMNAGSTLVSTKNGYQLYLLDGDPMAFNGNITLQTPRFQSLEIDDETMTATLNVLQDVNFNIGLSWTAMCDDLDFESLLGDFKFVVGHDWKTKVAGKQDTEVAGDVNFKTFGNLDQTVVGKCDLTIGETFALDVTNSLNMTFAALNLGAAATEPFVLGNKLVQLFNTLLVWLAGHTHSNGNNGSPTGPPITPPQPEIMPLLNTIVSTTIKGQ
ncbi:MAG: phage baseplate assembly protein V [Azonexus sp.]